MDHTDSNKNSIIQVYIGIEKVLFSGTIFVKIGFPVEKSISLAVSSLEAVASIFPQGLHLTEIMYPIYRKKIKV